MFIKKTTEIPISCIKTNSGQPRKNFDTEPLMELRDSIKEFGVLQPLIVKKNESGEYLLIAERGVSGQLPWQGLRRYRP